MKVRAFLPAALVLAFVAAAFAGGWSVITVKNLPEYLVAGKPTTLTFLVRQHGVTLSDGTTTMVTATDGNGRTAKALAKPTGNRGEYSTDLSLPEPGTWTIEVDSDLGVVTWRPINVIRPNETLPAALPPAVRGEHLFVAKGCLTCHVNKEIAGRNLLPAGPELTGKKFPADYLKRFLADPAQARGTSAEKRDSMPNLNLSKDEIESLTAFINRERPTTVAKAR